MKKISLWILLLLFTAALASAQESATQQQLDKLGGQIQDLTEAQERQNQRLQELERKITELTEKLNAPVINDSASREDLRKLAEQVQEIDRKRQEDRDLVLKQIEKLASVAAAAPVPATHHSSTSKPTSEEPGPAAPATPQKGYEYEVKPGDTLGLILKAYRDQGVKVTRKQIIAANPKMNPEVLIPGKKIFIPDPAAK